LKLKTCKFIFIDSFKIIRGYTFYDVTTESYKTNYFPFIEEYEGYLHFERIGTYKIRISGNDEVSLSEYDNASAAYVLKA